MTPKDFFRNKKKNVKFGEKFLWAHVCRTPMSQVASTRPQSAQYFSIFKAPYLPRKWVPGGVLCVKRKEMIWIFQKILIWAILTTSRRVTAQNVSDHDFFEWKLGNASKTWTFRKKSKISRKNQKSVFAKNFLWEKGNFWLKTIFDILRSRKFRKKKFL